MSHIIKHDEARHAYWHILHLPLLRLKAATTCRHYGDTARERRRHASIYAATHYAEPYTASVTPFH